MAPGLKILPRTVPGPSAASLPATSLPPPGLIKDPEKSEPVEKKSWQSDLACLHTSLVGPREEQLPQGCCRAEKQFGLAFSQQMLGTIRINGLETQVRAIQKLPIIPKTTLCGEKG